MSRRKQEKEPRRIKLTAHDDPRSPITEQYRLIRNNIRYSSADTELKTIMVTSADPHEGKSTTAANLATVLAQKNDKVLLVDTDFRKPTIHHTFFLRNVSGMTSVLTKHTNLEAVIFETDILNLDVLPSGPIPPNPAELLDSKAMEQALRELRERYKYIIFDTPPVLAVTDALIMANYCDGVIFVVSSGRTQKERALNAKELLDRFGANTLGVVVNGVGKKSDSYYGQYS